MCADMEGRSHALHWRIERQHGLTTLILAGELDLASSDDLVETLDVLHNEDTVIVIDLDGLEFMDSTGLRILGRSKQRADADGHRFLLGRVSSAVRRVLHVAGLTAYFDYVEGSPPDEVPCRVCDQWVPAGRTECIHCGARL